MPTYAYRCAACDHRFDAVQRMADAPLTDCPVCSGSIKRVIQNVPVVFKGSGWYKTDSRKSTTSKDETAGGDKKTDATAEKPSEKAKSAKSEPVAAAAD